MITIDYCGYHTHNPDRDLIYRPTGSNSYLFLLVLAPMTFTFADRRLQKASAGACILYPPGCFQHYQADREFFNSYVHFFCDPQDLEGYDLRLNELFYPDNVEELNWLLKKIFQEFINRLAKSDKMTSSYLEQLLILLHRGQQREAIPDEQRLGIYSELLPLRSQMLGTCEQPWSVDQLCSILNIGKSQLYEYYTRFFNATPREELIQARLQKAKYLLGNDALTIKQAAYESGFQNICHFNRLFKSQCGCTPGEYRQRIMTGSRSLDLQISR